ncbi:hypothetical protein Pcinc_025571 [Petrolisthes cinctipes]|uniref:Uncharacterized protein n=1 Tax=Petrolisthes cinctipes TaxID=88211 RepID=A0AAE1K999_PETCI|nr:hypothetical protein Pcinc_025571 [Petrolisthes cinctipes]
MILIQVQLQEIASIDSDSEVDEIEAADAALPCTTGTTATPFTTAAAVTQSTSANTATLSTFFGTQSTLDELHIKSNTIGYIAVDEECTVNPEDLNIDFDFEGFLGALGLSDGDDGSGGG